MNETLQSSNNTWLEFALTYKYFIQSKRSSSSQYFCYHRLLTDSISNR